MYVYTEELYIYKAIMWLRHSDSLHQIKLLLLYTLTQKTAGFPVTSSRTLYHSCRSKALKASKDRKHEFI